MHIKDVKVTNNMNVLVQVPGFVVKKWSLKDNDKLEVCISDDEQTVIIRPKKIRPGGDTNTESKGLARSTTGCEFLQGLRQVP